MQKTLDRKSVLKRGEIMCGVTLISGRLRRRFGWHLFHLFVYVRNEYVSKHSFLWPPFQNLWGHDVSASETFIGFQSNFKHPQLCQFLSDFLSKSFKVWRRQYSSLRTNGKVTENGGYNGELAFVEFGPYSLVSPETSWPFSFQFTFQADFWVLKTEGKLYTLAK